MSYTILRNLIDILYKLIEKLKFMENKHCVLNINCIARQPERHRKKKKETKLQWFTSTNEFRYECKHDLMRYLQINIIILSSLFFLLCYLSLE